MTVRWEIRNRPQKTENTETMSKLEEASVRLEQAVGRLSAILDNGGRDGVATRLADLSDNLTAAKQERDTLKSDVRALKSDQQKLNLALREAQENYAALKVVHQAVAGRLDGAIGELKNLLGQ